MSSSQRIHIDKEKLKKKFDVSNFDLNAVIRGIQLTLVGAQRALQNPAIFTNEHYKQAAIAVAAGIGIRLIIAVPIYGVRILLWFLSLIFSLEKATWDDKVVNGLNFIEEYVLQVPFFLMTLMRYITPTLDNLFMDSIRWVDQTYIEKHKTEDPRTLRSLFYPNLKLYDPKAPRPNKDPSATTSNPITKFLFRSAKKALLSLTIYALSYTPYVGRFVLPAASFHTFNKAVGLGPATALFATGLLLPRSYLVIFLQTYFASRSLMRDLLDPYFTRLRFTPAQRRAWFHPRAGLLFGFSLAFYALVRVPLVGVLVYGLAEASTAYLVTKITDPPPPPGTEPGFADSQLVWSNKQKFLSLSLFDLDAMHGEATATATANSAATGRRKDEPPSYDEAVGSATGRAG